MPSVELQNRPLPTNIVLAAAACICAGACGGEEVVTTEWTRFENAHCRLIERASHVEGRMLGDPIWRVALNCRASEQDESRLEDEVLRYGKRDLFGVRSGEIDGRTTVTLIFCRPGRPDQAEAVRTRLAELVTQYPYDVGASFVVESGEACAALPKPGTPEFYGERE